MRRIGALLTFIIFLTMLENLQDLITVPTDAPWMKPAEPM